MKAVLFDFWGTLVENGVYPSPVRQVRRVMGLRDTPFPEFITTFEHSFMTKRFATLKDAFEESAKAFGLEPSIPMIESLIGMWNKNTLLAKLYPESTDVLLRLKEKGVKIGLVSNTDSFSVTAVLEKYKLPELFDHINLSCDAGMLKSDPEMFATSLKALGVSKDDAVMVGDSMESDILGAQAAGIRAILIDRRNRREYEDKILNLAELERMA